MGKRIKNIIAFDQTKIKYYYGIPHCHSTYSTGRGTPSELYELAIKSGHNFLFITDHNNSLSESKNKDDQSNTLWQNLIHSSNKTKKISDEFIPLIGFETKTLHYGDLNILNPKYFFTGTITDIRLLLLWMLNNHNSFISINHPHKNILSLTYDPLLNKVITSIEVCNGNPASKVTRHDKYYFSLLDKGWKLGAINGQDNHRLNLGDSENLTVCIANSLTKDTLISSFRERRTYSTESKYLKFHFTINDAFMGETAVCKNNKIRIMIFAEDLKYKITDIKILSTSGAPIKTIENINLSSIKYFYEHYLESSQNYFVVKIYQEGGKVAISSPIFIDKSELIPQEETILEKTKE